MSGVPQHSPAVGGIGRSIRYVAAAISKIVSRITGISALTLAIGCYGPSVEPSSDSGRASAAAVAPAPTVTPEPDEPAPLGKFNFTFYYVVGEDEIVAKGKAVANENVSTDLVAMAKPVEPAPDPELVAIYEGKSCAPIADVSREFAAQLSLQGTGKLRDGRVLNWWGPCSCERSPCFQVVKNQWGTAGNGRTLQPFRTVAVDRSLIKLGSLLYVPALEGRTMPGRQPWGGFVHDGCVVADDTGGGIRGQQIDLFVGRKAWFYGMSRSRGHGWARQVPVFDGSKICERNGRKVGRKAAAI
jgi:3D (Asp-Asp-Asp) domain-containing protein